jgi:hypothetical protein
MHVHYVRHFAKPDGASCFEDREGGLDLGFAVPPAEPLYTAPFLPEASDGATRKFPTGSVLLIEDTTGAGHSTKVTSAADAIVLAVNRRA